MSESNPDLGQDRGVRHRSPRYPLISLPEAIERAEKIWQKANRHEVVLSSLAEIWGISKTSSALPGFVAALIKFGLLTATTSTPERHVKLSQMGIEILIHPEGSPERATLLKKAALSPDIYSEIFEKYHGDIPDDSVIKPYLLLQKHFNPSSVGPFLRAFRETLTHARLSCPEPNSEVVIDNAPAEPLPTTSSHPVSVLSITSAGLKVVSESNVVRELPIPLEGGLTARIPYPLSEEDYAMLLDTLVLWKKRIVRPEK